MEQSSKAKVYVGMDVHKDSIEIALAAAGGGEVRRFGRIGGERKALAGAVRKLESAHGRSLVFVYEAGPCGYGIHRFLVQRGHPCWVVAPSMTPRRSSDRVKTDRRDADKLARLARAGELTAVYVPDAHDEAIRDLVRTREDAVAMQRQARQRLKALLLRHDVRYVGKSSWTPAHRRWLAEEVKMPHGAQQIAFEEYVQAVDDATARIERMITAIGAEIEQQSGKVWLFALWGESENVWRIEWQVRKDVLRRFGIRTFEDLFAGKGDVLRYLAGEHDSLRVRTEDSNRSRWPLHPLWEDLLAQIGAFEAQGVHREIDAQAALEERLRRIAVAVYGYTKRVGAIVAAQNGQPHVPFPFAFLRLRDLVQEMHHPLSWRIDVEAKCEQMRLGQW